jgi:hypothetical protein
VCARVRAGVTHTHFSLSLSPHTHFVISEFFLARSGVHALPFTVPMCRMCSLFSECVRNLNEGDDTCTLACYS